MSGKVPKKSLLERFDTGVNYLATHFSEDTRNFNVVQFCVTVVVNGVMGGLIASFYLFVLNGLVTLIWELLFEALVEIGTFSEHFPEYNFIWMGSLIFVSILSVLLFFFPGAQTGEFSEAVGNVHEDGKIPPSQVLPMFFFSLLSVASGSGVGPEAPILVIGGGASSWVGEKLKLKKNSMRVWSLTGTYAALSAFFGSPVSGIHALEFPHRMGLEFFEAFPTGVASSFISSTILQLFFGAPYGLRFNAETNITEVFPIHVFQALLLGVISAIICIIFWGIVKVFRMLIPLLRLNKFKFLQPFVAWVGFSIIGMLLPATLFWGEPDAQNVFGLNLDPLERWRGSSSGIIDLGQEYSWVVVFMVGVGKMVGVAWSMVNQMKGGVLFPLFAIGGAFGQAGHMLTGIDQGLILGCMMSAVQAGITRTPLASSLVTSFLFYGFPNSMLIPISASTFLCVILTYPFNLFPYQMKRNDISIPELGIEMEPVAPASEGGIEKEKEDKEEKEDREEIEEKENKEDKKEKEDKEDKEKREKKEKKERKERKERKEGKEGKEEGKQEEGAPVEEPQV